MIINFTCQICAADALEMFDAYRRLPRVTSDAKPWPAGGELGVCHGCGAIQKLPTDEWRTEAARIYQNYEMYHLSRGAEQLVFADVGEIKPRSERLVEFILSKLPLPDYGTLIDIGCGNGEALKNFSLTLPHWKLSGSELTDRALTDLRALPNFATLYTMPPGRIEERFTLVTMIHSLEHMPAPLQILTDAIRLMESGGMLFVEVPDVETSPFDLLVADHLMHFSRTSLAAMAARAGVSATLLANDIVPKEITMLGARAEPQAGHCDPDPGIRLARSIVAWLAGVMAQIEALASDGPIGIFGTSIAAMALYGVFRERVAFFVDEDLARVGKTYQGTPVLAPKNAHRGVPVVMALPPERAQKAAERLSATGMHAVCPPPFVVA
ncbi:MAG TPA: methyltransferase domain-containing protein [Xanthobacteraceae bacterium]|nr:methyltransferase domain-containing protein [Xanthobacteraceae bacterium]